MPRTVRSKIKSETHDWWLWLKFILLVNIIFFIVAVYFSSLKQKQFYLDEYFFLRKAYFFDLFFIKHDFADKRWLEDEFNQPRLGPYIYGTVYHLNGIKDIDAWQKNLELNDLEINGELWFNSFLKNYPHELPAQLTPFVNLLYQARKMALLFTCGIFIIIFYFGLLNKNFLFTMLSVFLLANNYLMLKLGGAAMTDSFQLFFFSLSLVLSYYYLKSFFNQKWRRLLWLSFAIGVNSALAAGVKVTGIMGIIFFMGIVVVLALINLANKPNKPNLANWHKLIISLAIALATFFILFVFINPQLYHQPFTSFWQMFTNRWQVAEELRLAERGLPVNSHLEAVKFIFSRLLLPHNAFGNFGFLPFADILLLIGGLSLLVKQLFGNWYKRKTLGWEFIVLTWFLTTLICLTIYLKNDWDRYYLPLESAITLIQVYALSWGIQWLTKL
jgi:hypothetical protein